MSKYLRNDMPLGMQNNWLVWAQNPALYQYSPARIYGSFTRELPTVMLSPNQYQMIVTAPAQRAVTSETTQARPAVQRTYDENRFVNPTQNVYVAQVAPTAPALPAVAPPQRRTYLSIQNPFASLGTLLIGTGAPGVYQIPPGSDWTPNPSIPQNDIWIARDAAGAATAVIMYEQTTENLQ